MECLVLEFGWWFESVGKKHAAFGMKTRKRYLAFCPCKCEDVFIHRLHACDDRDDFKAQ